MDIIDKLSKAGFNAQILVMEAIMKNFCITEFDLKDTGCPEVSLTIAMIGRHSMLIFPQPITSKIIEDRFAMSKHENVLKFFKSVIYPMIEYDILYPEHRSSLAINGFSTDETGHRQFSQGYCLDPRMTEIKFVVSLNKSMYDANYDKLIEMGFVDTNSERKSKYLIPVLVIYLNYLIKGIHEIPENTLVE